MQGLNSLEGTWQLAKTVITLQAMPMIRRKFLKSSSATAAAIGLPELPLAQTPARNPSTMNIQRIDSQASHPGPAEWFTGSVRVDLLFNPPDPARVAGACVTFEPSARTAWHTHPLGQTLIVTDEPYSR